MTSQSLLSELQILVSEAKKKNGDIRSAADRSLQELKSLPNTSEAQTSADLARRPHFINPFLLACASKNAKLILPGVTSLQRLILARGIATERVHNVLSSLLECSANGLDIQLKTLQSIQALLQFYGSALTGDLPATLFEACGIIQQSKTSAVSSTAAATFQQAAAFLFERLESGGPSSEDEYEKYQISEGSDSITVSSHAYDAYRVFEDICLLTGNEKPNYLSRTAVPQSFGLELIETILTNHAEAFDERPELHSLLISRVVPLVTSLLSDRLTYATTVRTVRILCILLREFFSTLQEHLEIPLSLLNHMLEADGAQPWRRAVCMETFRVVYSSGDLAIEIYAAFDQHEQRRSIIQENLANFVRIAAEKPSVIGIGQQSTFPSTQAASKAIAQEQAIMEAGEAAGVIGGGDYGVAEINVPGISTQWSTMRIPCLDQFDKSEPPIVPETYVYSLALTCIGNLSDVLARVVLPATMQSQRDKSEPSRNADSNDGSSHIAQRTRGRSEPIHPNDLRNGDVASNLSLVSNLVNSCWPAVLATSSTFLYAALDADFYRTLIRSCQKFTQVAGLLRLATPRDAFMTTLAKAAIPANLIKNDLLSPVMPSGPLLSPRKASAGEKHSDTFLAPALESPSRSRRPSFDMSTPTLSQRNLMCLRALINLAIALGPVLDQGWSIVLDSLQKANVILAISGNLATARDYRLGSQNADGQTEAGLAPTSLATEIAAVDAATTRMLASTNDYTTTAFLTFLKPLCSLVSGGDEQTPEEPDSRMRPRAQLQRKVTLPVGTLQAGLGHPQYLQFAIAKIGEVAKANLFDRLMSEPVENGWDLLISTLLKVSTSHSADATARFMAADVLGSVAVEAAVAALSNDDVNVRQAIHNRSLKLAARQIKALSEQSQGDADSYASADIDVQRSSLEALRAILDRCGDALTSGWPIIFEVISTAFNRTPNSTTIHEDDEIRSTSSRVDAAVYANSKLVRSAFGSVQLICSDFLDAVPRDCMPALISLVARFCSQRTEMNISLTAIGLVWNISDHLRASVHELDLSGLPDSDEKLDENLESMAHSGSTPAMWLMLQRKLVPVTSDDRADVRNGAIRTIFRIIDASGERMRSSVWTLCLASIILEMGDRNYSAQATLRLGMEAAQSAETDALDGTSAVVLDDIAQVLQADIETISALPSFTLLWNRFLDLHTNFVKLQSPKLTTLAWSALSKVLLAASEASSFNMASVQSTFSLWIQQGDQIRDAGKSEPSDQDKALMAHLSAVTPLVRLLKGSINKSEVQAISDNVESSTRKAPKPQYVSDVDVMTSLQSNALQIMKSMMRATADAPAVILSMLSRVVLLPYERAGPAEDKQCLSGIALSKGAIRLISDIVQHEYQMNTTEKYHVTQQALAALSVSIEKKYRWKAQGRAPSMWRTATAAACDMLPKVLQTLRSAPPSDSSTAILHVFVRLSGAIGFADLDELPTNDEVLGDEDFDLEMQRKLHGLLLRSLSEATEQDDGLITRLIRDVFSNSIIHMPAPSDSFDLERPLDDLYSVRFGRTIDQPFTPRLEMAYYHLDTLFNLASSGGDLPRQMAKSALPRLILRCALPLKTYVADQPLRGKIPTPMSQRLELLHVLSKLRELVTDQADVPAPPATASASLHLPRVADGTRQHLSWLAPLVHKAMVQAKYDPEMSAALSSVLDLVIGSASP